MNRKTLIQIIGILMMLPAAALALEPVIIPRPAEMDFDHKWIELNQPVRSRFYFDTEKDVLLTHAVRSLHAVEPKNGGRPGRDVVFASLESGSLRRIQRLCRRHDITAPDQPESYVLQVTPESIILIGADDAGLFYGLQTLRQLITEHEGKKLLPLTEIRDAPRMEFRGILFFTGKDALQEQKQLIDFMAAHKYNHVIIVLESMEFDSLPELRYEPFAQSQEDIKELIEYARERYITPIPMMSVCAHTYWAFRTGAYLHLAENPNDPRALNLLNPESYKLIFTVMDEIIDLFETDIIHIGLDEIDFLSEYPYQEETRKYALTELLDMYLHRVHRYLRNKGINQVMIWGDTFLSRDEAFCAALAPTTHDARARRAILHNLPYLYGAPDFIVFDWHYTAYSIDKFTSLTAFHDDGFPTVASTWYYPENIRNFSQRALQEGSLGLLQTTWSGFNFSMADNTNEYEQFSAYLLAADYSWSGRTEEEPELPYDYRTAFWQRWYSPDKAHSRLIELSEVQDRHLQPLLEQGLSAHLSPFAEEWLYREQAVYPFRFEHHFINPFSREAIIRAEISDIIEWQTEYRAAPGKKAEGTALKLNIPVELMSPASDIQNISVDFTFTFDDGTQVESRQTFPLVLPWYASRIDTPVTIDGNLSDWQGVEPYVFDEQFYVRYKPGWTPEKTQAEMYLAHDDENIYLAFKFYDEEHYNDREGSLLWQGDGVQLRFDFAHDRKPYYNEDDLEIGFYLTNDGNIHRQVFVPGVHTNTGIAARTDAEILRDGSLTIYETVIPKDILIPEPGRDIGFTFSINNYDSTGIVGSIAGSRAVYAQTDHFAVLIMKE